MIHLRNNFYTVELTNLGDEYKSFRILEPDKKWTVPYLKYSYRSIYHTKRRGKNFYCSEEEPLEAGTWQIICTSKEAKEADAKLIVECTQPKVRGAKVQMAFYKNYGDGHSSYASARVSLETLLASKGLTGKSYLIIQKM